MFDHFAKNSLISYPGVAQLVGRLIWVLTDPMFPDKSAIRKTAAALALFSLDFSKPLI